MSAYRLAVPTVVITALLLAGPAPAAGEQFRDWDPGAGPEGPARLDLSVTGGYLFSSNWSDLVLVGSLGPATGALQQVLSRDLAVTPGRVFDATVTYWRGRAGVRVHGAWSSSCLAIGTRCPDAAAPAADQGVLPVTTADVETWIVDVGAAIGLRRYEAGQWVWPYAFLGLGGVVYRADPPVLPPLSFIERPGVAREAPDRLIILREDAPTFILAMQETGLASSLSLNVGLGTDLRIPVGGGGLGLRLEVSDHVVRSPLAMRLVPIDGAAEEVRLNFAPVHNLRAAAGLVLAFGLPGGG